MPETMEPSRVNPNPRTAAALLLNKKEKVISLWVERVSRSIQAAKNERHPVLVNILPTFLDKVAEALTPGFPRESATEGTTIAQEHGGERARVSRFSPEDVILEYQILRDAIFQVLGEEIELSRQEETIIRESIDRAMTEALNSYFLVLSAVREQFTLGLTHDLRGPIAAVQMIAQTMLRSPLSEENKAWLGRIILNTQRADRMIQDLLDSSVVKMGERLNFKVAECELLALTKEVLNQFSSESHSRFMIQGDPITGFWNKEYLQRAIENLVSNAIKYSQNSSPITIKISKAHGTAVLSVHNEGPTIPVEEQETLFQAFRRVSATSQRKKGWGLGLAIARGVAESHGGSISVDSAPERGTTFTISIPQDTRPFQHCPTMPTASNQ